MTLGEDFDRQRLDAAMHNLAREDGLLDKEGNWLQAPHCDALVLHAPGTCTFCDKYPDRQNARIARRVAFTGESHHPTKSRCPSEYFRPVEVINKWERNRPTITSDLSNFKVVTDDVEIVETVTIDDKTENTLEFSQIVSVLANVTANLRALSNDSDTLRTIQLAESALANGEALVEILRSDLHPPILFEPSPTESVIVAWEPNVHELITEIDPPGYDGKVVAYVRPESVKADDFTG